MDEYLDYIVTERSAVDEICLYICSRLSGIRVSVLLRDGGVWGVNELDSWDEVVNNPGFIFVYLGNSEFLLTRQLDNVEYTQHVCEKELKQAAAKQTHGMFSSHVVLQCCDLNKSVDSALQLQSPKGFGHPAETVSRELSDVESEELKVVQKRRSFYCRMEPCFESSVCFALQKDLNHHHKEVHQTWFACPHARCRCHFSNFAALKKHRLIHDKSNLRYSCHQCSKSFVFRSKLALHEKCHATSHPFKCQFCSKEYKVKSDLTRHTKSHNAEV